MTTDDAATRDAVEPRCGFLPPCFRVPLLPAEAEGGWAGVAPLVPLTDLPGTAPVGRRLAVRLAWTRGFLHLRAECRGERPTLKPDIPPEDGRFWTQDHVEWRLLRTDGQAIQFIITPDGRCWDSHGERHIAGRVVCCGAVRDEEWELEVRLACATLGLEALRPSLMVRGLVAAARWTGEGQVALAACSAVELGFQQGERFARFVLSEPDAGLPWLDAIALPDERTAHLTLHNPAPAAFAGHLALRCERADRGAGAQRLPLTVPAGGSALVRAEWPREARRFSRLRVAVEDARGRHEIAAPSLCAAPLPLPEPQGPLVHPYLFFDSAGVVEFRRKAALPVFRPLAAKLSPRTDRPEDPPLPAPGGRKASAVDLAARAGGYLPRWLLCGDASLAERATRAASAALDGAMPDTTFHLHEGNVSALLALSYDTFHPLLDEAQRAVWRQLLTKFLDLYLDSARKGAWTVSAIPNANPVSSAGAGFLALALWNEEPAKAREAIAWLRRYIWHWLDYCFGADGGNTEGCQYWQYGTESWLRFAALCERFFGRDDGMVDHPALRHGMNMIRVALCNDGALHGINDTIPVPCGAELAWFWAGRYDDRFALWYGDHAQRWYAAAAAANRPMPYNLPPLWAILFRPDLPEQIEQPEPLPQAFALRSIEYGIVRSGPEWNCRWTAGLKGSRPPYTHHNQADTGALFVDLRGERLLVDPGYYKPQATDHCLPLIGGRGPAQPRAWTGAIAACERRGPLSHLAVDSTLAYPGAAKRVVRHLVLAGDEGLVLLDDMDAEEPVTQQYPCGGTPSLSPGGRTLSLLGRRARMKLTWVNGPARSLKVSPERSLHDTHWGYHFADCRLFPVTATYTAEPLHPMVAVLQDATEAAPRPCKVRRTANALAIILPSGLTVRFIRCGGTWTWDADGA